VSTVGRLLGDRVFADRRGGRRGGLSHRPLRPKLCPAGATARSSATANSRARRCSPRLVGSPASRTIHALRSRKGPLCGQSQQRDRSSALRADRVKPPTSKFSPPF